MKKIMLLIFILLNLNILVYAQSNETNIAEEHSLSELFYNSYYSVIFDNSTVSAGENLEFSMYFQNMDQYMIPEPYLRVYLFKGNENPSYPTNLDNNDNIVFLRDFRLNSLGVGESFRRNFSFKIPENLNPGDYRLEIYMSSKSNPIIGEDVSFFSPRYFSFKVENDRRSIDNIQFNRRKTNFAGGYAQTGPGVKPDFEVPFFVGIDNNEEKERDIIFDYEVCRYNDFPECESIFEEQIELTVSPGYNEERIRFKTPDEPYGYEIVMKLKDKKDNLLSFYKSRFIVEGEFVSIKKFTTRNKDVVIGENEVYLTYTGSFYPSSREIEDALITILIESEDNRTLLTESFLSSEVGNSPINTDDIYIYKTHFSSDVNLSGVKGCAEIYDVTGEILYDRQCFESRVHIEDEDAEDEADQSRERNSWIILIAGLVIVFILVGIGYYFILKKKRLTENKNV